MPLKADDARGCPGAAPRIRLVLRPAVLPVRNLLAIDPRGQMLAHRVDGHGEPLSIARDHAPGGLAIVNAASAVVHGLCAVFPLPLVANLGFIPAPERTRVGTKEDAAVQPIAINEDLKLEHEVAVALLRLQICLRGC